MLYKTKTKNIFLLPTTQERFVSALVIRTQSEHFVLERVRKERYGKDHLSSYHGKLRILGESWNGWFGFITRGDLRLKPAARVKRREKADLVSGLERTGVEVA